MNEVFSLMRKDILSFAKGKTLQQFCILPSAFCIRAQPDKLKFEIFLYKYPEICYTIPNETKEEPPCSDTPMTNSSTFPQARCA